MLLQKDRRRAAQAALPPTSDHSLLETAGQLNNRNELTGKYVTDARHATTTEDNNIKKHAGQGNKIWLLMKCGSAA